MGGVTQPCSVCYTAPARHTCMLCGRLVCSRDYEPVDGLCKFCAKIPREKRFPDSPDIRIMR